MVEHGTGNSEKAKKSRKKGASESTGAGGVALVEDAFELLTQLATGGTVDAAELMVVLAAAANELLPTTGDRPSGAKAAKKKRGHAELASSRSTSTAELLALLTALARLPLACLPVDRGVKLLKALLLCTGVVLLVPLCTGDETATITSLVLSCVASLASAQPKLPMYEAILRVNDIQEFIAAVAAAALQSAPDVDGLLCSVQDISAACCQAALTSNDPQRFDAWLNVAVGEARSSVVHATMVEGCLAACRQVLAPLIGPADESRPIELPGGGAPNIQRAASILASCDAALPSLTRVVEDQPAGKMSRYTLRLVSALAGCAGHQLAVCSSPLSPEAAEATALPSETIAYMAADTARVAVILADELSSPTPAPPLLQLVAYLEAVCATSCAVKPAASPAHYATLLALLMHALSLLPVDASALSPARGTFPLAASFPAAAGSGGPSAVRAAVLRALRSLTDGSNSQQLRGVLSFLDHALSFGTVGVEGSARLHSLPVAELALMVLEGCGSKPALRVLGQHGERLASGLTCFLANVAGGELNAAPASGPATFSQLREAILEHVMAATQSQPHALPGKVAQAAVDPAQGAPWKHQPPAAPSSIAAAAAVATALRALESLLGRPQIFRLGARHIARALHAVDSLWAPLSGAAKEASFAGMPQPAAVHINACHMLITAMRHREDELGRLVPLMLRAVRALLVSLVRAEAVAGQVADRANRVRCAEALAQVMEELAALKVR